MLKNMDAPVNDLAGEPIYDALGLGDLLAASSDLSSEERAGLAAAINKVGRPKMSLKRAAVNALQAMFEDERNLDGAEKLKRWQLAMKVHAGGEVELTIDDLALIKRLVGKLYGPAVVGPVWSALEAKSESAAAS